MMPEESKTGVVHIVDAMKCGFRDSTPLGPRRLTIALILMNIAGFIASLDLIYPLMRGILWSLEPLGYLASPACVASGGCLPQVLASMFIHAGLLHLAGNMIFLYLIGDNVEITLGPWKTVILYLASGIAGAAVESIIQLRDPTRPVLFMVGASAAVSGLLGAYLILYPGSTMCYCIRVPFIPLVYYCFRIKAANYIALWVTLQFVILSINPYVAVWAHMAGLITGLALAWRMVDRARVQELRLQMARGRYRGHRIDVEELRQPSLSPLAQGLIVISAGAILVGLAVSIPVVVDLEDRYYNVYADVYIYRAGDSVAYKLRGIEVHVEEEPPPSLYIEYREVEEGRAQWWEPNSYITLGTTRYTLEAQATVVLASYHMAHVLEASVATLAVAVAASLASLYAVLARPEEVEVTYVPAEEVEPSGASPPPRRWVP